MQKKIQLLLAATCILFTTRSNGNFSHTIELEGDVIHIILTANLPMGWGQMCPQPIIYWIVNDDSLHLKVLHLWEGATGAAGCIRTDTVSITPSPIFNMPCKLIIEQSWVWESTLNLHSLEEADLCTVNVMEYAGRSAVSLGPNPAKDRIWLSGVAPGLRIETYDPTGRLVLEEEIFAERHQLDVQGLRKGLYLVRIIDSNSLIETHRLIVE